jgi:MFS family permease
VESSILNTNKIYQNLIKIMIPPSSDQESRFLQFPRTFRALHYRNFRLYWFGQIVSTTGTWMQIVAQSWLVYSMTDSPLMLGIVNFIGLLPVVPISLFGGVMSDRLPRRKLIITTEIILMSQAFVLTSLTWSGHIQIWHIVVLSFVFGAASAFEQPARLALIADTVGKEVLPNAVALNASVYNTARIIGPAIAGILVAKIGEAGCFFINGISYFAIILALIAMQLPSHQAKSKSRSTIIISMVDGFQYIWNQKTIRGLLVIVAVSSFLTLPYIALMPVFASHILMVGPEGLGLLLTSIGVGAIGGALIVANLKSKYRGMWLTISNIISPLFLILFCFSQTYIISLALVFAVGVSNAIRQTLANSFIQLKVEERYHGRVMSIFNLLFSGMSRFGALTIGAIAEFISAPLAISTSAFISFIIGIIVYRKMPYIVKLR